MGPQTNLGGEMLITLFTLMLLFFSMKLLMSLKMIRSDEFFPTHITYILPFLVCLLVFIQVIWAAEFLPADFAFIVLLSGVNFHVSFQMSELDELLAAVDASVRSLDGCLVGDLVSPQVFRAGESLFAH